MKINEVITVGDFIEYKRRLAVESELERLHDVDPAKLFGPRLEYWLDVNGRGNWEAQYHGLSFTILDDGPRRENGPSWYVLDVMTNGHDVATFTGRPYDILEHLESNMPRWIRLYGSTAPREDGHDVATAPRPRLDVLEDGE